MKKGKVFLLISSLILVHLLFFYLFSSSPLPTARPAIMSGPPRPIATPPPSNSDPLWLHTSGTELYDSNGQRVRLYACNILNADASHTSATDIANIKSYGFNAIRIMLLWNQVQPNNGNSVDSTYFTTTRQPAGTSIDNIVQWAADNNLYVIMTPTWIPTYWPPPTWALSLSGGVGLTNGDGPTGDHVNILGNPTIQSGINYMYQWMGQHYSSKSNVIFESFNELVTTNSNDGAAAFANFNHGWVSAIEAGEGNNRHIKIIEYLILNPQYTEILTAPYISGTHNNIILASHDYIPGLSAAWSPTASGIASLTNRIQGMANAAHAVNRPYIDTEFSRSQSLANWDAWFDTVLKAFAQSGAVGWGYFNYNSTPTKYASGSSAWNILNPTIRANVLPILQKYMV